MTEGHGKLREMTKPNGDHIWNDFGMIEGLVVYLEAPDRWLAEKLWSKKHTNMKKW